MSHNPQQSPLTSRLDGRLGTIAILTGGGDKPYALGLATALVDLGISLDFIGSDEVSSPELLRNPQVNFLNLRGDQSRDAPLVRKCFRLLAYYVKLIRYAAFAETKIFHILWNNKLELLDRILLLYYRLLGKKIVFTAHNVNVRKRDGRDTWLNRALLRFQYHLVDGIFVHTAKMREELIEDFGVRPEKITVIPFGINSILPDTGLAKEEARRRLGLQPDKKILLFFGNIAPYKGLEYLIDCLEILTRYEPSYRLIIAGKPKNCGPYWSRIKRAIAMKGLQRYVWENTNNIPDEEVEFYFRAADVLILPYTHIFQSGVLLTSYYFGLPVIAADVGSLREDIVEEKTGYIFRPKDSDHLASMIETYFQSELYEHLDTLRTAIRRYACERYSWARVAEITCAVYRKLGPAYAGPEDHAIGGIVNEQ